MQSSVKVLPSQHIFQVEDGETVLAAAIRQGVGLPYGCQDGACGSCKCSHVEGAFELKGYQPKALSEAERAQGLILTCRTIPRGDMVISCPELPAAGVFPVKKLPSRVVSMRAAAPDVMVMQLQLPANDEFRYHPGQYVQFLLPDGSRRSYSMANAPDGQRRIELHLRHMPGGRFTDTVFGAMKEKDILRLEGPFGSFYLREDDASRPIILLASGTGFAPAKAILEQLRRDGNTRSVTLYWGCRTRSDLYMHDWVEALTAELPWLRYVPVLSEPRVADAWTGRTGLVHTAVMQDLPDLSAHAVYACGAPVMVEAAQREFTTRCGLPADQFFSDAFTPAT